MCAASVRMCVNFCAMVVIPHLLYLCAKIIGYPDNLGYPGNIWIYQRKNKNTITIAIITGTC